MIGSVCSVLPIDAQLIRCRLRADAMAIKWNLVACILRHIRYDNYETVDFFVR